MKTVLVTGGRGFIGSHFVEEALKREYEIIDVDNLTYAADLRFVPATSQFEFVWCDITNENHVDHIFKKYNILII